MGVIGGIKMNDMETKVLEIEKKIDLLLEQSVGAAMKEIKTMDSMGRITIPKSFRKVLGIDGESVGMEISLQGDKIILKKVLTSEQLYDII